MARRSDRYVTPGVIVAGLLVAGVVLLALVAAVTYLSARGLDPDPMLRLVTQATGALAAVGTFLLQLPQRAGQAKVERNTGQLTAVVADVLDELDAARASGRHSDQTVVVQPGLPPVPDATVPHPLLMNGNGPRPAGESGADQSARTQRDYGGRSEPPVSVR